jgi:hypothetical protein
LHFYRADALSGVGDLSAALGVMEQILEISQSPLIRAIAVGAKGEYLTKAGDAKRALPFFEEAGKFFAKTDVTADHGILQKWLGVCFFLLGKQTDSKKALRRAFKILYRPGAKPEAWMEALLWLERASDRGASSASFVSRLHALSGGEHPLLRKMGIKAPLRGDQADPIFSVEKVGCDPGKKHLDRASDIFWRGKAPRLGLDRVDELICSLIYAGEFGLPQYRLYEVLWPDELFSFAQHQKRLEQLVIRARAQGYKIEWKGLHLKLLSPDVTASGYPREVIRGLSFLRENPSFIRRDVEKYFKLSRASAILLCREWVKSGVISASGAGYRVVGPLSSG